MRRVSMANHGKPTGDIITHEAKSGFVTLLNSKHAKTPPGLRTRYASVNTSGIDVQFRIPNAMVYMSYVLEGSSSACAFPSTNDICGAVWI